MGTILNSTYFPLFLIMVVFYFFMIRPQQNKIKKEKNFENGLKVGDKVITKGGLHGKISEIGDTTVVVETMSGKQKYEKSSISIEMSLSLAKK